MTSIRTLAILSVAALSIVTSSAQAGDYFPRYTPTQPSVTNFTPPAPMARPVSPVERVVTAVANSPVRPTMINGSLGVQVHGSFK
jgi:hypothetical protein